MKIQTGRLPLKYRSAARFVLVGAFGTGLQYGIYYLLLIVFQRQWPDVAILTSVAFSAGFFIEMVCNYFLTSFYTFRVRPTWKNAGGFLFGRAINYVIHFPEYVDMVAYFRRSGWHRSDYVSGCD